MGYEHVVSIYHYHEGTQAPGDNSIVNFTLDGAGLTFPQVVGKLCAALLNCTIS